MGRTRLFCVLFVATACTGASELPDGFQNFAGNSEFIFTTALVQGNGSPNESVHMFLKSPASCTLTHVQAYTVGPDPYDLVYHQATRTLYVANSFNATIHSFKVDFSGRQLYNQNTVTQVGPSGSPTPFMMAVHSSGYLYAVDGNANGSIGGFSQNSSTGALTQFANPNQYVGTGTQLWFIAMADNHLYVNDYTSALIRRYSISTGTGLLTAQETIGTGTQPWSMFIHKSGKFLYTTNSGSGSISQYSRDTSTGVLTQIAAPVPTGTRSIGLAVGTNYLYAGANTGNQIYRYSINQTTGALTNMASIAPQQAQPYGMALSRDENCLYVAELANDNGTAGDQISIYNVSAGAFSYTGQSYTLTGPRFFAVAY